MINRVGQTIENEIPRRLAEADRELRGLKSKQFAGVDSVAYRTSVEASFSTTVGANSNWWRDIRFTGAIPSEFLDQLAMRIYIDNDNDDNYRLPLGPSLSSGQLKCYPGGFWYDHHEGLTTEKWFHLPLVNGDSSSHTFYCHFILILHQGSVA